MPPKLETTISCPLSQMQLFWYKRLLLTHRSSPHPPDPWASPLPPRYKRLLLRESSLLRDLPNMAPEGALAGTGTGTETGAGTGTGPGAGASSITNSVACQVHEHIAP